MVNHFVLRLFLLAPQVCFALPRLLVISRVILCSIVICFSILTVYFSQKCFINIRFSVITCAISITLHLGITPIYGSFEKSLYDCQPLQFHGHNFTAVRTFNQGSFVDMLTELLTLAVAWRVSVLQLNLDLNFYYKERRLIIRR